MVIAPGLAALSPAGGHDPDCQGFDVELTIEVQQGRFVATSVEVRQRAGGPAVTGDALRSIPLARMTTELAMTSIKDIESASGETVWVVPRPELTPQLAERLRTEGPTSETLEWVAYLYRQAHLLGDRPTVTVEQALGVPRSTVGRWIALARRRGFLGRAEGSGKAAG